MIDDTKLEAFTSNNEKEIQCIFVGIGDLNNTKQIQQRLKKNRTVHEIKKYIIKNILKDFDIEIDDLLLYINDCYIPLSQDKIFDIYDKFNFGDSVLMIKYSTISVYG